MTNKPPASRGSWFRDHGEQGQRRRLILDKALEPHERAALGSLHGEIWARDAQWPPAGD